MPILNAITTDLGRIAILDADLAGLKVSITHVAVGVGAYDPETRRDAVGLLDEKERVSIANSVVSSGDFRLDLSAAFTSTLEYWVREVGFFDENGVLVWLWSSPESSGALGYKSAPISLLLGLSLTITDVPFSAVQIIDAGLPLELSLSVIYTQLDNLYLHTQYATRFGPVVPAAYADYPEVYTADRRMSVLTPTPHGNSGGSVRIDYSDLILIGEKVTSTGLPYGADFPDGKTPLPAFGTLEDLDPTVLCRMRVCKLPIGWETPLLNVNSTYYIRAKVTWNGLLVVYYQKGSDSDPIPVSLEGTPGANSGGGFDSTPIDILLARVVTGGVGATPIVTKFANARRLFFETYVTGTPTVYGALNSAMEWQQSFTLNWARAPLMKTVVGQAFTGTSGKKMDGWAARARFTAASRYSLTAWVASDWETDMSAANKQAEMTVTAMA